MKLAYLAALLPFLVAGCATNPPADDKVADANEVCQMVYPIGSSLPKKVCSAPMTEAERQRMNAEIQNQIRPQGSAPPGK